MTFNGNRLVTKPLDGSFLAGVTRDSILALARDLGYQVEERAITVAELLAWASHGEAALMGTAAVLAEVGAFVYEGEMVKVGDGTTGANTARLRAALVAVQRGEAPDPWCWTETVSPGCRT